MMKRIAAMMLIGTAACVTSTGPDFQDEAPVLLEIEYTNAAWVPEWNGYYIDSGGGLYSWNADDRDLGAYPREEYTHAELMQKVTTRRRKLRNLSTTKLQEIAELIPAAAKGTLTQPVTRCADAGVLVFRAYTFDSARGVFKPLMLRSEGDRIQENTSQAARQIYAYLNDLDLAEHIADCQPE